MLRQLVTSFAKKAAPAEKSFAVVVVGAGEPQHETVRAKTALQAAELACNEVARRRLASTDERSWRLTALVDNARFEVVVATILKAEVIQ
jgi:precorrin-2 methylase